VHCDYRKLHCDYKKIAWWLQIWHCCLRKTALKSSDHSRVIFWCTLLIWKCSFRNLVWNDKSLLLRSLEINRRTETAGSIFNFMRVQAHDPMERYGLERAKVNNVTLYAFRVHMYQCINELWLHDSSNFALYYNYYKVSFIPLKGYLTQRWMAITVSILKEKLSYEVFTLSNHQIFTLIYHRYFPKGRCMIFQGRFKNPQRRCKTISGKVPTSPQNPAMFALTQL
jgi:hypothetical protein